MGPNDPGPTEDGTFKDTLQYLFDLQFFGMKLGLENTERLLGFLNHPEKKFPTIHIAGTNGKGSTCAMLDAVLRAAGYKTGLYTSPHLFHFSERIRINGQPISESNIVRLTQKMRPKIDELRCTFFEATTAMAFDYFAENDIDAGIIETGLGGRLDATNIIQPEVSVITSIGFDHMEYLGNTIEKIAAEKAGIIKELIPCVIGNVPSEAVGVFLQAGIEKNSLVRFLENSCETRNINLGSKGSSFDLVVEGNAYDQLTMNLTGRHQIANAALTILALKMQKRFPVPEAAIRKGLKNVVWPGRLHLIRTKPVILVDAAHNADGMRALREALTKIYKTRYAKLHLIIGMLKDKDYEASINEIVGVFDRIYTVTPNNPRALPGRDLADLIGKKKPTQSFDEIQGAIEAARTEAAKNDLIVITGSHFVLSEISALINRPVNKSRALTHKKIS